MYDKIAAAVTMMTSPAAFTHGYKGQPQKYDVNNQKALCYLISGSYSSREEIDKKLINGTGMDLRSN